MAGLIIVLFGGLILIWQVEQKKLAAEAPDSFYKSIKKLEIADSLGKREIGLMNRTELCTQCAMLFVFETEGSQSFWMKDTLIPLDIVFMDSQGYINTVYESTTPKQQFPTYNSKKPSLYVLETNAGYAKNIGLTEGIKVDIEKLRR